MIGQGTGTLRSEDGRHQRNCKVEFTMRELRVDEQASPVRDDLVWFDVADTDNFPVGDYILNFQGKDYRRRRDNFGHYLAG